MRINIARQRFDPRGGGSSLEIVRGPVNITAGDLTVTGAVASSSLATVADPGDAGTITPPTSGADFSCTLTSGTAGETRVLGTPARLGQRALVILGTDGGGAVTMTNASGWQDGGTSDDVATFGDAGDAVLFEALGTGAATDWRATALKGVALS